MARALWKGSISFGLVNIPIELHTAVRDHRPHFRMLHAKDRSPVRFQRVCIKDGHPVAWEDLVKGYEYAKGRFVVLTKDDFQAAALEKTRTVDILDFVKSEEIDDRYFETPYYLTPQKGSNHAYALLRDALRESGRVGMAKMLIDNLAAEWDPSKYTDEYRDNLMKLIKARVKGEKPSLPSAEAPPEGKVVDLMERLRQSLAQSQTPASRAKSAKGSRAARGKGHGKKKSRHAA